MLADLEDDIERTPATEAAHAGMIAALARRHGLEPVDRAGAALIVEHAARLADHANELTLVVDQLDDVLAEADFWAGKAGRSVIDRADVEAAIASGSAALRGCAIARSKASLRKWPSLTRAARALGK